MTSDDLIAAGGRLERVSDGSWRWYRDPDSEASEWFPSVTTILAVAVAERLQEYFKRTDSGEQETTLAKAGASGSRLHDLIERDLTGKSVSPVAEDAPAFEKWLELKRQHGINARVTELSVAHRGLGYAGTLDLVGEFDGGPALMDIKTGYYDVKAGFQLAAYQYALRHMGLGSLRMVGLSIKRDGSRAEAFVYEHEDWCLKSFLSCFEVWKALNYGRLSKLQWRWLHVDSVEVKR